MTSDEWDAMTNEDATKEIDKVCRKIIIHLNKCLDGYPNGFRHYVGRALIYSIFHNTASIVREDIRLSHVGEILSKLCDIASDIDKFYEKMEGVH